MFSGSLLPIFSWTQKFFCCWMSKWRGRTGRLKSETRTIISAFRSLLIGSKSLRIMSHLIVGQLMIMDQLGGWKSCKRKQESYRTAEDRIEYLSLLWMKVADKVLVESQSTCSFPLRSFLFYFFIFIFFLFFWFCRFRAVIEQFQVAVLMAYSTGCFRVQLLRSHLE